MRTPFLTVALSLTLAAVIGCSDDEPAETTSTSAAGGNTGGNGTGGDGGSGAGLSVGGSGTVGGGGTTSTGGTGGVPTGDPGELTIDIVDLAGADGKTVIVSVLEGDTKMGGICVQMSGDPASASEVVGAVADNPCAVGAPVTLSGGLATLRGGLYTSGMLAPELCLIQDVVVDGDTTVTLNPFLDCQ